MEDDCQKSMHLKNCEGCNTPKPLGQFPLVGVLKRSKVCQKCIVSARKAKLKCQREKQRVRGKEYQQQALIRFRRNSPSKYMIQNARRRAKERGMACTITELDVPIPELCPVLGIPLKFGIGTGVALPNSPTIDRIDPTLPYIPGNVRVISYRANMLKNNMTYEEWELLGIDMKRCRKLKPDFTNVQTHSYTPA